MTDVERTVAVAWAGGRFRAAMYRAGWQCGASGRSHLLTNRPDALDRQQGRDA